MPKQPLQENIIAANFEVSEAIADYHCAQERNMVTGKELPQSEQWHPKYKANKQAFSLLIKTELAYEKVVKRFFKEQEMRLIESISWWKYNGALQATEFNFVDEIDWNGETLKFAATFTVLENVYDAGITMAEEMTGIATGLTVQDPSYQRAFTKYGLDQSKKITGVTKERVKAKLATALQQGLSEQEAANLLIKSKTVTNPYRATMIARTETVNAHAAGIYDTGVKLGAKEKEWLSAPGSCPICDENKAQGRIAFTKEFFSGDLKPAAHPNCRCLLEIIM